MKVGSEIGSENNFQVDEFSWTLFEKTLLVWPDHCLISPQSKIVFLQPSALNPTFALIRLLLFRSNKII